MKFFSIRFLIQIAWLAINLYCVIAFSMKENAFNNGELRTLLFMQVTVLSVPLGYFFGIMADYLITFQLAEIKFWLSIFLIILGGYIQWFILIPLIWEKLKNMRKNLIVCSS